MIMKLKLTHCNIKKQTNEKTTKGAHERANRIHFFIGYKVERN